MEGEKAASADLAIPVIHRWFKSLIVKVLAQLKQGHLQLRDQDEILEFGSSDGHPSAILEVHNSQFYMRLFTSGSNGAADSFIDGDWSTPDLTELLELFAANMPMLDAIERYSLVLLTPLRLWRKFRNRNNLSGSKRNILAHYDIGNEFYQLILDKRMQYSSGIYTSSNCSLAEAQTYKLHRICQQLKLVPSDHLLEIGSGWGGLAIFAASEYGCRVTTTTISDAQYAIAQQRIHEAGLTDKITLLKQDYRTLTGLYDKLVSVEMIEAVGHDFLPDYFRRLGRFIRPGGRLLLQAITIDDRRYDSYRKGQDFIQERIFPGGCLPSLTEIVRHLKEQTHLQVTGVYDFAQSYARTLADWRYSFEQSWSQIQSLGFDEVFYHLWQFYFCYCEAGFKQRTISVIQLDALQPLTFSPEGV
jgi:cyclopropane-fatty-acyl-phospholipid synthase